MQIELEHNRKEQKSKNVRIESNNLKEQNKTDEIIRTYRIELRITKLGILLKRFEQRRIHRSKTKRNTIEHNRTKQNKKEHNRTE